MSSDLLTSILKKNTCFAFKEKLLEYLCLEVLSLPDEFYLSL